jgi:hypothetical protein
VGISPYVRSGPWLLTSRGHRCQSLAALSIGLALIEMKLRCLAPRHVQGTTEAMLGKNGHGRRFGAPKIEQIFRRQCGPFYGRSRYFGPPTRLSDLLEISRISRARRVTGT